MITELIANAFTDAGFKTTPEYGREIQQEEIDLEFGRRPKKTDIIRRLQFVQMLPNEDIMNDSLGVIEQGQFMLYVIGLRPFNVVKGLIDYLKALFVTQLSGLGLQESMPQDLQGVRFWRFRVIGGINQTAEKFGTNYWFVDQLLDVAARKI